MIDVFHSGQHLDAYMWYLSIFESKVYPSGVMEHNERILFELSNRYIGVYYY